VLFSNAEVVLICNVANSPFAWMLGWPENLLRSMSTDSIESAGNGISGAVVSAFLRASFYLHADASCDDARAIQDYMHGTARSQK